MKATLKKDILQAVAESPKSILELDKLGDKPNQSGLVVGNLEQQGYVEMWHQRVTITTNGRHHLAALNGQPDYAVARARQVNRLAGEYVPPAWNTRIGSEQAKALPSRMFGKEHHA